MKIKIKDIELISKKVLIAKKKQNQVGKFYIFDVLKDEFEQQDIQLIFNESVILFHPSFEDYQYWPELVNERNNNFESIDCEYVVIINILKEDIPKEIVQYTEDKRKKINEISKDEVLKEKEKNIYISNFDNDDNQSFCFGYLGYQKSQMLEAILKTNIRSQAMQLFNGMPYIISDNIEEREQNNQIRNKYEDLLFRLLSLNNQNNQEQFDLNEFKQIKKYYYFYNSSRSQLNHINYTLLKADDLYKSDPNLIQNSDQNGDKQEDPNKKKNDNIIKLQKELLDIIQYQKSKLNQQQNKQLEFEEFRDIVVEKEEKLPLKLIDICISGMIDFFKMLRQVQQYYKSQQLQLDIVPIKKFVGNLKNNVKHRINAQINYLEPSELLKTVVNDQIKQIAKDIVDFFNKIYLKTELSNRKYFYQINEAKQIRNYKENRKKIVIDTIKKMRNKLFKTLNEAMYLVNFYFVIKNKSKFDDQLKSSEEEIKEEIKKMKEKIKENIKNLEQIAQDDLKNLVFYYSIYPKIQKSIQYHYDKSEFYVQNNRQEYFYPSHGNILEELYEQNTEESSKDQDNIYDILQQYQDSEFNESKTIEVQHDMSIQSLQEQSYISSFSDVSRIEKEIQ